MENLRYQSHQQISINRVKLLLSNSADANRTEKYNYAQDDNGNLTEEDVNEGNPAKRGLDVGKLLDTSKVNSVLIPELNEKMTCEAEVYTYGPSIRIRVFVVTRYYTSLKVDQLYKKRVTWLGEVGLSGRLAVVEYSEYSGTFPGQPSPSGNSKDPVSEYLRIPVCNDRNKRHVTDRQTINYL
ncbi:hypothetical protein CHS0354_017440 [Potamilus streckersoni]|uniref:Uncharacterized protein n=1 Tax=Potamilus streckersoni TaxID=2493646 RepID=A0AAE0SCA9_9BIVA|nr:hypothetical protein CHS0354_017440 [Potamilus streckersoni]